VGLTAIGSASADCIQQQSEISIVVMTFHHITATSHSVLMKRMPQKVTSSRLDKSA
jgi:hypothetical protein